MEARHYLELLGRWWLLVVVTVLAGVAAGWATAPSVGKSYRSTAVLFVGLQGSAAASGTGDSQAGPFDQLLQTYAILFPSGASAQAAVNDADLPRSAGTVQSETRVTVVPNSDLLQVSVTDPSEAAAPRIANAMAAELTYVVSSGSGGLTPEPAAVVTPARTATVESSGDRRRIAEYGILGLLVGLAAIVAFDLAEGTIRRPEEVESRLGLPILALLPTDRDAARTPGAV